VVSSPANTSASASSTPGATSTSSPAASEVTSLLPLGTYTAEIPAGVEAAPGQWRMEITNDGITWLNPETGASFSPGDLVEVTSTTIVFAADPGCPDQGGTPTNGTYQWHTDGEQLVFTVDSDSCAGRSDTLTSAPWELAP
jgi:hypothetical protein